MRCRVQDAVLASSSGAAAPAAPATKELVYRAPAPAAAGSLRSYSARVDECSAAYLGRHIPIELGGPGRQAKKAVIMAAAPPHTYPKFSRMSGIQQWSNAIFLFANIVGEGCMNEFTPDGAHVTWLAQPTQTEASAVIQRLIHHTSGTRYPPEGTNADAASADDGDEQDADDESFLPPARVCFAARLDGEPYVWCGDMEYVSHDSTRRPMRFIWRLRNSAAMMAATGSDAQFKRLLAVAPVLTLPTRQLATMTTASVKLGGLAPSATYFYSCGGSPAVSFTSPPSVNSNADFSALIFGDIGYLDSVQRGAVITVAGMDANWSASLTRDLISNLQANNSFDWSWIVGDIAYADDAAWYWADLFNFNYEEVYDGFMEWLSPVTSRLPMMVSVGNHESECHSPYCILNLNSTGLYLNNFSAYNARWAMPSPESGGVGGMWYSWDFGAVHVVSVDTSTDFPNAPEGTTGDSHFPFLPAGGFAPNGTYMAWLEADLAAARAAGATWIIAGGHRPAEDFDSAPLVALFGKYGVDMYFAGHGHSYTRNGRDTFGDNTTHIMVGGSGCDEMPWPTDQMTVDVEEDAFPTPRAACEAWCVKPAVRRAFAGEGRISANDSAPDVAPEHDPCRYCTAGGRSESGPVYMSDNMAIGQLSITYTNTTSTLLWQLLRAPDGKVLDTYTLTKQL